ncbi:MAG TPA: hypothetical protein VLB84_02775, partial [Bacteroidia bacterium]|nr:hypothetical protein [Bacteroidia bacterium]
MRITTIIGACIIQLLNSIVYGQNPYSYKRPPALPGHWQTSDLQSQHSDTSLIYKLFEKLKKEDHKINSILLVKNGKLSIEEYFGMYSPEKQHDLRSVTKSI